MDDELPVAHVIFLDLRAFADTPELHQGVARVRLVLGQDDLRVRLGLHDPDLDQVRIGHEVERHQIRAGLFDGRRMFLERLFWRASERFRYQAGPVPDDLVQVRGELPAKAPHRSARATSSGLQENSRRNSRGVDCS